MNNLIVLKYVAYFLTVTLSIGFTSLSMVLLAFGFVCFLLDLETERRITDLENQK